MEHTFVSGKACIKSKKLTQKEHKYNELNLLDGLVSISQLPPSNAWGYDTERI